MAAGPTKLCPGPCAQEKDRFTAFAPRWGHCPDHTPFDAACAACLTLRNSVVRQPRCYECDALRDKRKPQHCDKHEKFDKTCAACVELRKPKRKPKTASEASTAKSTAKKPRKAKSAPAKPPESAAPEVTPTTVPDETPESSEVAPASEAAPSNDETAPSNDETAAALVVAGPSDARGSLLRDPARPKRAIAVMLRRALGNFTNRCARVVEWEQRVAAERAGFADLLAAAANEDDADVLCAKDRIVALQTRLNDARTARAFTEARIRLFAGELRKRTLAKPDLAAASGDVEIEKFARLVEIAEDVIDTATLRAGGSDRAAAFDRIVAKIGPRMGMLVQQRVKSEMMRHGVKQLAEDEARSRRDEGIWKGAITWDYNHESGASLATRCYMPVKRALQIRTRADRKIGVKQEKNAEGQDRWDAGASSLDALLSADGDHDGGFEPLAASYSARGTGLKNVAASVQANAHKSGVIADVTTALDTLTSPEDRQIATMIFGEKASKKAVAESMGISVTALNVRVQTILASLRTKLSVYKTDEGDESDSDL